MDVREKLVELLKNAKSAMKSENLSCDIARNIFVVDFMIANGVTVLDCKLGDKKTNADRIRSMNDEELAMSLYEIGYEEGWDKPEYALEWLRKPAEVNE